MNVTGLTGAGLQMFSHGVMTALFFACVGVIYDRTHTRDIPSMGGLLGPLPLTGAAFLIGGLASMGMPGLSGFMAEIPILIGMWNADHALLAGEWAVRGHYALAAIAAGLGIVITAAYIFRAAQAVFLGVGPPDAIPPTSPLDRFALIVLALTLIALGIFPQIMAPLIESAVTPAARLLGGF
jgi:NADH-quinone oxidoreductase subunit M